MSMGASIHAVGFNKKMTDMFDMLQRNLRNVRQRINRAANGAQRDPCDVRLIAVSKTFPAAAVVAAAGCGQHAFGENYLQEFLDKKSQVEATSDMCVEWHFIGPIQSNKTRPIAEQCDWVQSVDRLKIAQRLSDQRPASLSPLNVLLQVNISGEATKSGADPREVPVMAAAIAALPRLRLRGLMAIPEPGAAHEGAAFERMHALFNDLRARGLELDTLSMGMSDDLEAAIAAGSTMVRVGTAIFGHR